MLKLVMVEDNERLAAAMTEGLQATGAACVVAAVTHGEVVLDTLLTTPEVHAILMDVALAGQMNGIEAAVEVRREFPRMPVVFYSIQDDDAYFRAFLNAGILSHYAYVRKSNYLLPELVLPLLKDAVDGRSFVDPDIEERVQDVRHRDANDPFDLLEPNERTVAHMLAQGMTNEQIAVRLGFRDKRTISRTNGQIYEAWGLKESATDEKIARTRAAIIVRAGRLIQWDNDGISYVLNPSGDWVIWDGE